MEKKKKIMNYIVYLRNLMRFTKKIEKNSLGMAHGQNKLKKKFLENSLKETSKGHKVGFGCNLECEGHTQS